MVMDVSPLQPYPRGLFSNRSPGSHTEGWIQMKAWGQRNQSPFYVRCAPAHFPPRPFIFILPILPSPELSTVLAWLQLRGNIFTFLPSFYWTCYIRTIPAAQGKELERGKHSKFHVERPFSSLLCFASLSTICHGQDDHRRTRFEPEWLAEGHAVTRSEPRPPWTLISLSHNSEEGWHFNMGQGEGQLPICMGGQNAKGKLTHSNQVGVPGLASFSFWLCSEL